MNHTASICRLRELVAALDRRVPQRHRAGEAAIAESAATLKARAVERIALLAGEPSAGSQ